MYTLLQNIPIVEAFKCEKKCFRIEQHEQNNHDHNRNGHNDQSEHKNVGKMCLREVIVTAV